MKRLLNTVLISGVLLAPATLLSPAGAFANGVFKCTDAEGNTTFSFTSCATAVPENIENTEEEQNKVPAVSRKSELQRLDAEISQIQDDLESVKRDYEDALSSTNGSQRSDALTHQFDSDTMRLLSELNNLQAERQRVTRL